MIGFLRGEVDTILDDRIIIDVNGVGYNILMPSKQISLLPDIGNTIKLYTHLSVREDAMTLYGFLTLEDLSIFRMLIGVSGVGPKFALGVLSTFDASELRLAIMSMDAKTISKAPGIGLKSAQKIILELKDKISIEDVIFSNNNSDSFQVSKGPLSLAMEDASEALIALGYSATDSLRAVRECGANDKDDAETIIKKALKIMKR